MDGVPAVGRSADDGEIVIDAFLEDAGEVVGKPRLIDSLYHGGVILIEHCAVFDYLLEVVRPSVADIAHEPVLLIEQIFDEDLVLALVVAVIRHAGDPGEGGDVRYGDTFIFLFLHQAQQRRDDALLGQEI